MIFKSFAVAFSMYSKIPMPRVEWNEKNLRYALCFFPFVGAVIGALIFCWMLLCQKFSANIFLQTLPLLVIPLLVTGGFHADGFLDTSDALSSYKSKEEKLLILKDPHIGSFAVIKFFILCLIYLALASLFELNHAFYSWCLSFVLARIFSAFAAVNFKCAKNNGTLYAFSSSTAKKITNAVLVLELLLCSFAMVYLSPISGSCIVILLALFFAYFRMMALKKFGGVTGDLCGWFVCMAETIAVLSCGLLILLGF
ncbi:MAG: adenosylcobinamide-GDP ribazoletransferase [Treponema sp.]|nr:adenosylcobinamide-GDP ribazoletransferase [Treponema sp.]